MPPAYNGAMPGLRNRLLTTESVVIFPHHLELGSAASLYGANFASTKKKREEAGVVARWASCQVQLVGLSFIARHF